MLEDLFTVYANIVKLETNVCSKQIRKMLDNVHTNNIHEKWIIEMCYSFYNLGVSNKLN